MRVLKSYKFTNAKGYTTYIWVYEITNKSVFYTWANEHGNPTSDHRFRMSLNSFKGYVPLREDDDNYLNRCHTSYTSRYIGKLMR